MHRILIALALGAAVTGCAKPSTISNTNPPMEQVAAPVVEQTPVVPADLVALEAIAANRYVEAETAQEVLVRLRITTDAQAKIARGPANIAIVIDTSASMQGDAIEQARAAALAMVDGLSPGDRLSIVAFHSRADLLVPSTEVSEATLPAIHKAITEMQATGTTALSLGLEAAVAQLEPYAAGNTISRLVLLSDGIPNDAASIPSLLQRLSARTIAVTALGLGVEYDEVLLAGLASATGGRFHFVEGTDKVAAMFRDEVLHIDRVVGLASTLALSCGPGVTVTEVLGRPEVLPGTTHTQFNVGDLAGAETKDIVVRLWVEPRAEGATVELFDAQLQYRDAVTKTGVLGRDAFLAVAATGDDAMLAQGADAQTVLVSGRAIAAARILWVTNLARGGDLKTALLELKAAQKTAEELAVRFEDEALATLAEEMRKLRPALASLVPPKAEPQKQPRPGEPKAKLDTGGQLGLGISGTLGGGIQPGAAPASAQRGAASVADAESVKRSHSAAYNALH